MSELTYISREGRGRRSCAEKALLLAKQTGQDLVFVAALGDVGEASLSKPMAALAADELSSLLTIRLRNLSKYLEVDDVKFKVVVRSGAIDDDFDRHTPLPSQQAS